MEGPQTGQNNAETSVKHEKNLLFAAVHVAALSDNPKTVQMRVNGWL